MAESSDFKVMADHWQTIRFTHASRDARGINATAAFAA
ncbi:hypothetical protein SAMN05421505_102244 [Sinosporangium album]|uniref:Uncharacterized protein n=1 Tax=Sinosporangium album TaxID=504805 RepID=A0A1G7SBX6_9ACTN|nr:hypothetical protein SAMN05421505_102244 [Sinosporangium album]